jgi:hypothetical protein
MSQYPPTTMPPPAYPQPGMVPQRTSAAAVTSLIFGIVGCAVITGIIAIITGIIGISATKNPNVKGRGMAIAGLILGLIGTIAGAGCFGTIGIGGLMAWKELKPAVHTVSGFAKAAESGNYDAAMQYVDQTAITKDQLQVMVDDLKALGEFQDFTPGQKMNFDFTAGVIDVTGTMKFKGGATRSLDVSLRKQSDGQYKITSLNVAK